jgi:DNA-binding FadR family transcriptional regulator
MPEPGQQRQRVLRHLHVAENIGRRIVTGEIGPGTTLPNMTDLAKSMAVSRPVLREAIKLLAGKGLLEMSPRRGTVVRDRKGWNFFDENVLNWRVGGAPNAAFLRDLYELRRIIEPEAAASAAVRATPAMIAELERALERLERTDPSTTESVIADVVLHQRILEASGNDFIIAFAPAIATSLGMAFSLQRRACPSPDHFIHDHGSIVRAIARGSAEDAREFMRRLLHQAEIDATASLSRKEQDH